MALREVMPRPNRTNLVEVEDENGDTQLGVVERLTEKGEIVVKIPSTGKTLIFKPDTNIKPE